MGGFAMYAGFLAGMLVVSRLPELSAVFGANRQPWH